MLISDLSFFVGNSLRHGKINKIKEGFCRTDTTMTNQAKLTVNSNIALNSDGRQLNSRIAQRKYCKIFDKGTYKH